MTVRVDDVIATYMKLRNEKDAIEAEIKSRVSDLKAKMEKMNSELVYSLVLN